SGIQGAAARAGATHPRRGQFPYSFRLVLPLLRRRTPGAVRLVAASTLLRSLPADLRPFGEHSPGASGGGTTATRALVAGNRPWWVFVRSPGPGATQPLH